MKKWISFAIFIICLVGIYLFVNHSLNKKQFYLTESLEIYIEPKSSFSSIMVLLKENKLIKDSSVCKGYFIITGKHRRIKAGYYIFDKPLSIIELAEKLVKGEVVYYKITFPEGSNIYDVGNILEREKVLGAKDYYEAINTEEILMELKEIDSNIDNVEGYLFPETYHFAKGEKIIKLIKMMIDEFKRRNLKSLKMASKELGFSINEIVTMASLIEKESKDNNEKPLIASVFYNRLKKGMMLQCDPTVIYAHYLQGRVITILTADDMHIESAYNTYRNFGLPAGPICNPGKKSLYAAMHPAHTNYLYFVSKGNGSHYFSKELNEHLRAKVKYLK